MQTYFKLTNYSIPRTVWNQRWNKEKFQTLVLVRARLDGFADHSAFLWIRTRPDDKYNAELHELLE